MAGKALNRKNKMPGNADYYCGNQKSGIKRPATPYITGNKARKEKKKHGRLVILLRLRLHIAVFATKNKTFYRCLEQVLRRGFAT